MAVAPPLSATHASASASASTPPPPAAAAEASAPPEKARAEQAPGAAQAAPPAEQAAAQAPVYTVVAGDSLWRIATRMSRGEIGGGLYSGASVPAVMAAILKENPELATQGQSGPKRKPDGGLIYPGDPVRLPAPPKGWPARQGQGSAAPAVAQNAGAPPVPPKVQLNSNFNVLKDAAQSDDPRTVLAAAAELGRLQAADPSIEAVPQFQELATLVDAGFTRPAPTAVVTQEIAAMLAKLNAGGVSKEDATAMTQAIKAFMPFIQDKQATLNPILPLLKKAGVEGLPDKMPTEAEVKAQETQLLVKKLETLQQLLEQHKASPATKEKLSQAVALVKAGKGPEANAAMASLVKDPEFDKIVKSQAATGQ